MATYLVLGRFDREGVSNLLQREDDSAAAIAKDIAGVKVSGLWFTTGVYDFVIQLEARDNRGALAFAAAYGLAAEARTETLAAEPRVDAVVTAARRAHTRHLARFHTRHERDE